MSSAASRHGKYIEPIVSLHADFYLRLFVVVRRGRMECSESGTKIGNVFNCPHCGNYEYHSHLIPKNCNYIPNKNIINNINCPICNNTFELSKGPLT
jgi:tRNA G26 N,N-dimethylase Trm1